MFRLRVFGGIDLVDPAGEPVRSIVQQPKRAAVLSYLALAGGGARNREGMLLLFWPESSERHARRSLNQTVHFLRQILGPNVVESRGPSELAASSTILWCDAVAFAEALSRGESALALELYRGDLLPGFFVGASREFEDWLEPTRAGFRRQATDAASALAVSTERRGGIEEASVWARRAVQISPEDEACLQRLIGLLDRVGDRAGALQIYDTFARRLRREYDAEPSAETTHLIAQVRSRSNLAGSPRSLDLLAAVPLPEAAPCTTNETASRLRTGEPSLTSAVKSLPTRVTREAARHQARVRFGVSTAVVVLTALVSWSNFRLGNDPVASAMLPPPTAIMVEPFSGVGISPVADELGRAFTGAVVDQLAQVPSFAIVAARERPSRHATPEPAQRPIPQMLLAGSVLESGGKVRIDVRLTNAGTGTTIRTGVFEHELGDRLPLVDSVSHEVSSLVRTAIGQDLRRREWRMETHNNTVYALMKAAGQSDDIAALLARSGDFAGSARALMSADSSLAQVERIAPQWGDPMVQRALGFEQLAMLHFPASVHRPHEFEALLTNGMIEANRAIALDAHNPAALETFGSLSFLRWMAIPMSQDSSVLLLSHIEQALRAALAADPNRTEAWSMLSSVLFHRADYAGAYIAAVRAYRADAYLKNPEEILSGLVSSAYEIRDDSAAQSWCDELNQRVEKSWLGAYCRLMLLAWNGSKSPRVQVVSRAWALATDTAWSSAPGQHIESHLAMLTAAVLARYGLRDSAEAVIARAKARDPGDPELLALEAHVRELLGNNKLAAALLMRYVAAQPFQRAGVARSRQFESLVNLQHQFTQMGLPSPLR